MAKLDCEDQEYKSYFEIDAGPEVSVDTAVKETQPEQAQVTASAEVWQFFRLNLVHGGRTLSFTSPSESKQDYAGFIKDITRVADGYLLCRKPKDEVGRLISSLEKFAQEKISKLVFEPVEPSFELVLERQHGDEIRVNIWVDEGNVLTSIARWDALGLRFFTTQGKLLKFIDELKRDFAC